MCQLLHKHDWLQVGEIGLDFSKTDFAKELQMEVFEKQLEMAISSLGSLRVPAALFGALRARSRRAAQADEEEVRRAEERRPRRGSAGGRSAETHNALLQRLKGNRAVAREAASRLRLLFALPDKVRSSLSSSQRTEEVVKVIPPDRLLIETDSPHQLDRELVEKLQLKPSPNRRLDVKLVDLNEPELVVHTLSRLSTLLCLEKSQLAKSLYRNSLRALKRL